MMDYYRSRAIHITRQMVKKYDAYIGKIASVSNPSRGLMEQMLYDVFSRAEKDMEDATFAIRGYLDEIKKAERRRARLAAKAAAESAPA